MSVNEVAFRRGVVSPMECLSAGWRLIKEDYWLFLGITLVGVFLGSLVPFGILLGPFMCGIYLCLLRRGQGQPIAFSMLFEGFNYFLPSLIATLIMIIPIVVIMVPLYLFLIVGAITTMPVHQKGGPPPDPSVPLAFLGVLGIFFLVFMLVMIVVTVLFTFTYPLIVDRKLSGWEAVQMSFKSVWANFGGVLGLTILNWLLTMVGLILCYVGAFFVMPITLAAVAAAYREVFPFDGSVQGRPPMDLR